MWPFDGSHMHGRRNPLMGKGTGGLPDVATCYPRLSRSP